MFKLAVDLCGELGDFQQLLKLIIEMMRALHPPLKQELEICLYSVSSLTELKKNLQCMLSPNQLPKLEAVLKTKPCKQRFLHENHSPVLEKDETVNTLFQKIGLDSFYAKKLQLKDALCIRRNPLKFSLDGTPPTDPKQLPYLVLHKLMTYDINCRSDLMPSKHKNGSDGCGYSESDNFTDGIHPVDTLLALILCSDDFLRQDLFSRLAKCQLSVPFILPDPFTKQLTIPLWAMRSIIKEWKCNDSEKLVPIIDYPMPIVSFICFQKQKSGKSKSRILNEVISDSHHHFFHRNCPGGHCKSFLGEGLVDMCWYLPAGEAPDAFPDAVTFLNLHGDARQHLHQSKFLSQLSFMCIVLLTEEVTVSDKGTMEILKMFSLCPGGIILLDSIGVKPVKVMNEIDEVYPINLTKMNDSDVKRSIQNQINKKWRTAGHTAGHFPTIEHFCKTKHEFFFVDEDKYSYREGLILAEEIISKILASTKEAILPLQGKGLWQAWAVQDRELYRQSLKGAESVSTYTVAIRTKKLNIRKDQMKCLESLSPVTGSFIVSLLKLQGPINSIVKKYFLQCLKLGLDNLSRENISGMQLQYQAIKNDLEKLEGKAKIKQQEQMKKLQDDIINASIGLEHLFREVGQVYEAAIVKYDISCLPKVVAELLIEGYPLEVMDGDVAHVPLKWVTAVLAEAVKMLEESDHIDPNIFVLSVLGLQGTGKSTMLNTVFGLQFNVSAGRCTRGAFIQLIHLDKTKTKNAAGCNYVLVVDTEGLRTLEHDALTTLKHDNELATFVIGLANMTLINVFGEVPGDIDDILQTSVHAFLRMREVKISPSCQFVHQNAGKNVKSEIGRTKFIQRLDKFTVDAANEEHCYGQYDTFNDVINFDSQNDVHHFPGLWKGDPPMAPVNQGYSLSAQRLKLSCIKALDKRVKKGRIPLSYFCRGLNDLWMALLKENFVFSFKNTMEITAYNSLENEYSKWDWEFRAGMLEWELKADNEIRATKPDAVPDLMKQMDHELNKYISELYKPLKSKMDEFFEGKQAEIMGQWRERFDIKLCQCSEKLRDHARKTLYQTLEAISKIGSEQTKYAKKITEKVQEYIKNLRLEQQKFNENLEKKDLGKLQLQKLLEKKLFRPEKLDAYLYEKLVTPQQLNSIKKVIQESDGQLTEEGLNSIFGGLSMDQVMAILKKGQQTEELQDEFDVVWCDIVQKLDFPMPQKINWELEVETTLRSFVGSRESKSIIEFMQRKRGLPGSLELVLMREKHYSINPSLRDVIPFVVRKVMGTIIKEDSEALDITDRIFTVARECLKEVERKETEVNTALIQELLVKLDAKHAEETAKAKKRLSFTPAYRLDIFLTACWYAIPKFIAMRESYVRNHGLQQYLERHMKGQLFAKYKNQYEQAKVEEAISNTLCAQLEEPIRSQVRKKLGKKMVELMKRSDPAFTSKTALKVKILTDLHEEDKFESYMRYLRDVKRYIEDKLKYYTIHFCDEKVHGEGTKLQKTAREEVTQLIRIIENKVKFLHKTDVYQWVTAFSEDTDLKRELGFRLEADELLTGYESLDELNLENLKCQIENGLTELKDRLHSSFDGVQGESEMNHWKDKPHVLLESLIGCTEQCPFCGEQCDLLASDHVKAGPRHSVEIHRSNCLQGCRYFETGILAIGFCPGYISGKEDVKKFRNADTNYEWHAYKDYQSKYPKWSISSDATSENSLYWMNFVGRYMKDLAGEFKAKPAKVPDSWSKLTWEEVRKSLPS